jgi:hypothetical protein
MDLRGVGGDRGDWMEVAQDSDRWWTLEYGKESSGSIKMPGIS